MAAADPSPELVSGMCDELVDQVLRGLDGAVELLRGECAVLESLAERLDEEMERWLESRESGAATSPGVPDPAKSVLSMRRELAEEAARRHRDALRALVAWWADAATVAVLCSAHGQDPDPVRIAAGDPSAWMTDQDLRRLPAISEYDRGLAELSLSMAGGPPLPDDPNFSDFVDETYDFVESVGLAVRMAPDGQPILVEDGWPDARRCRLWGAVWREHRMPLLPEAAQLVELLAGRGVAAATVEAVREAADAVEGALAAEIRIAELERGLRDGELSGDAEDAAEAEIEAIVERSVEVTELLTTYARALTAQLPIIRTGPGPT